MSSVRISFRFWLVAMACSILALPLAIAAPANAGEKVVSSISTSSPANQSVKGIDLLANGTANVVMPMATPNAPLACGYNVGFGGSGRWYRNCSGVEVNLGAAPFQGLWCIAPYSYRELSAFSFHVQIVSRDCSNPRTDK